MRGIAQRGVNVVRDHDDGHAPALVQIAQRFVKVLHARGVKARDRLVEDEQVICRAQGARKQHALLLPARELAVTLVL